MEFGNRKMLMSERMQGGSRCRYVSFYGIVLRSRTFCLFMKSFCPGIFIFRVQWLGVIRNIIYLKCVLVREA